MATMKKDKSKTRVSPYNDKELEFFRETLLNKRKETEKEIESLQNALGESIKNLSEESSDASDAADSGPLPHSKGEKYKLYTRQRDFLWELNNALDRIENKTYGICKVTGKKISKQRLEELPHTQLSMDAEKKS